MDKVKRLLVNANRGREALIEVRHIVSGGMSNELAGIELAKLLQEVLPPRAIDMIRSLEQVNWL